MLCQLMLVSMYSPLRCLLLIVISTNREKLIHGPYVVLFIGGLLWDVYIYSCVLELAEDETIWVRI